MVFCNPSTTSLSPIHTLVTILILIDGFLQFINDTRTNEQKTSHNPYFNRWFSAIKIGDKYV